MAKEPTDTLEIKPKFVAQRCPVCNGFGTVSSQRVTCHACEGKGYILIPND